jgi:hypothetical protein
MKFLKNIFFLNFSKCFSLQTPLNVNLPFPNIFKQTNKILFGRNHEGKSCFNVVRKKFISLFFFQKKKLKLYR